MNEKKFYRLSTTDSMNIYEETFLLLADSEAKAIQFTLDYIGAEKTVLEEIQSEVTEF